MSTTKNRMAILLVAGVTLLAAPGAIAGTWNDGAKAAPWAGESARAHALMLAQRNREPVLRPQTGPDCPYEPVEVTKPAPGQCGFNDLSLPVHGTFRCYRVSSRNGCVQKCEFVSCVNSNQ